MPVEQLTPEEQEALKEIQLLNEGAELDHETWCGDATASAAAPVTTSGHTPKTVLGSAEAVQVSPWGTVRRRIGVPPLIPEPVMECDDLDCKELLEELKRFENFGHRVWQLRQDKLFYFACLYNLRRNCLDWGHAVPQWLDEMLEEAPKLPPARFPNPNKQPQTTEEAWTEQLTEPNEASAR